MINRLCSDVSKKRMNVLIQAPNAGSSISDQPAENLTNNSLVGQGQTPKSK